MTRKQYQNATGTFSTQLAVASFLIGTLLLVLHLIAGDASIVFFGLLYVLLAFVCNFITLLYLIFLLVTQKNHAEYYTIKILLLLANIPIVFVYLKIVLETAVNNF